MDFLLDGKGSRIVNRSGISEAGDVSDAGSALIACSEKFSVIPDPVDFRNKLVNLLISKLVYRLHCGSLSSLVK